MPENIIHNRWISLQEICNYLGFKHHTIMQWIEQRNIPASKVGKLWRFKIVEHDQCVRSDGASEEWEVPQ